MKENAFRVEPADEKDIPALTGLLGMLFEQEEDFCADPEKQGRGLRMIISDASAGIVFVLRNLADGTVAGTLTLLFTVSTAMGGRVAVVEDVVLLPEVRRRGLGSLLIKKAVEYAQTHGLLRLTLLTDNDNTAAVSFYGKNGFSKSGMTVMRKFP